ncbi:hypothetical protein LCGC14_2741340, partial [marine sediment metagenome]
MGGRYTSQRSSHANTLAAHTALGLSVLALEQGTYVGDNTVNRAIAHGLGVQPQIIFFTTVAASSAYYMYNNRDQAITYVDPGAENRLFVTISDDTYFYVGNATNYNQSANASV